MAGRSAAHSGDDDATGCLGEASEGKGKNGLNGNDAKDQMTLAIRTFATWLFLTLIAARTRRRRHAPSRRARSRGPR
jgi:hypothetical protein